MAVLRMDEGQRLESCAVGTGLGSFGRIRVRLDCELDDEERAWSPAVRIGLGSFGRIHDLWRLFLPDCEHDRDGRTARAD